MITIGGQSTVYMDVDNTIIHWLASDELVAKDGVLFTYPNGVQRWLVPHKKHIAQLKEHHSRLTTTVVWSAAGSAWAELVIKTLGLEEYVDVCISKPNWLFDDLKVEDFMPPSRWLDDPDFGWEPEWKKHTKDIYEPKTDKKDVAEPKTDTIDKDEPKNLADLFKSNEEAKMRFLTNFMAAIDAKENKK